MNVEELQKEWRDSVIKKLESLEKVQEVIRSDISEIKINSTHPEIIEKIQERIRSLESFRDKALTLFFVIQFLIATGMMILNHFWK